MPPENYYIIKEEDLLELLEAKLQLDHLECNGVDNWRGYGYGIEEFLLDCINHRNSKEQIPKDIDFYYVAQLELQDYKKYYPEDVFEDDLK